MAQQCGFIRTINKHFLLYGLIISQATNQQLSAHFTVQTDKSKMKAGKDEKKKRLEAVCVYIPGVD